MFITFLKFGANKSKAPELMDAHNKWIAKGFADGKFLSVGSLKPSEGGVVLAFGETLEEHKKRIAADPFVREQVVVAETHEVSPARTIPDLEFIRQA